MEENSIENALPNQSEFISSSFEHNQRRNDSEFGMNSTYNLAADNQNSDTLNPVNHTDDLSNNDQDLESIRTENSEDEEPLVIETIDITPEKSGGVMKQIIKPGEGDECPGYGDRVYVHYTGWLLNNKDKPVMFDSNRKGEKCEFSLGRGQVIKGWDLGISTMKKGEVALFICQPEYAYGEMGYPPTIPPYTPLLFEVELYGWKLEDLSPKKDSGILRKILEKGEGTVMPNEGSQIKIKLTGYFNDEIFEDAEKDFILGEGCKVDIPEGLETALLKFRLKERSIIYLKSKYAFDVKGAPEMEIPPNVDIKYEVTVLSFEKAKEVWEMSSDEKFKKAKLSKENGISYFNAGNFKVALKQFRWILTCLENEPGAPADSENSRKFLLIAGYLNMALCFLKLENYLDAVKVCDKALELDPKNEKALFRRGQAKMSMSDCAEALQDFETLCSINPSNKAARNSVIICQEKIRNQNLKDRSIYNNMFEKFVKQDEERMRKFKTETGVWQSDKRDEKKEIYMTETQRLIERNNTTLRDANVIELSNTAK
ncbi:peptidyl-prolyl cis-trans isomerase FKBP4-like [Stegodyphus dumicola]|uniref:peptidyl-prolyl cis-trans isomerase FKBP4-like n=1 Tax=Stegodyphus dumicola TaxID=202533 RepID=UPI0015A982E2|nr:peptidyl-prolyl cis-trans isomerase FKBP4-like [Stegodyphus dumicola]